MPTSRTDRRPRISESDFQRTVIDIAHWNGWMVVHFPTSKSARGAHITSTTRDGKGWPDLILAHPISGDLLFRELKSETGKVTAEQEAWGRILTACGQDWAIWRPSDHAHIAAALQVAR